MKNYNYNLVKLLHINLDSLWRLEKFYLRDAKTGCKDCAKLLAALHKETKHHVALLTKEIAAHGSKGKMNE